MTHKPNVLLIATVSALATSVGLTGLWHFNENVFDAGFIGALLVPASFTSVAFIAVLVWLDRRGVDGVRPALLVLAVWALLCPLLTAGGAALVLSTRTLPPELAAGLEAGGEPHVSTHKLMQAAVRTLIAMGGAAWVLLRAALRSSKRAQPAAM